MPRFYYLRIQLYSRKKVKWGGGLAYMCIFLIYFFYTVLPYFGLFSMNTDNLSASCHLFVKIIVYTYATVCVKNVFTFCKLNRKCHAYSKSKQISNYQKHFARNMIPNYFSTFCEHFIRFGLMVLNTKANIFMLFGGTQCLRITMLQTRLFH